MAHQREHNSKARAWRLRVERAFARPLRVEPRLAIRIFIPRYPSMLPIGRDNLKIWMQTAFSASRHLSLHRLHFKTEFLRAMEANMTEARLEMLGIWVFLMLLMAAAHLYS
jgi:hypothetical protein